MEEQLDLFADNPEYQAFVEKFKPKKTTDDCYTPPLIYETVRDWACEEYGIDRPPSSGHSIRVETMSVSTTRGGV